MTETNLPRIDEKTRRRRIIAICVSSFAVCALMSVTDAFLTPPYFVKSLIKILLFVPTALFFGIKYKDLQFAFTLKPSKKSIFSALLLGAAVFTVIVAAYFLLRNIFDLSAITTSLESNLGVGRENYPVVAFYIPIVNAFLEEFFFRGFLYLALRKLAGEKFAFAFSSALFALYHCAMLVGWGNIFLFLLIMLGVFIGGVIFNLCDRRGGNIYPSYFTHMFANLGINFIGFILFGFIKL